MLIENFEKLIYTKYKDENEFNEFLKENLDINLELERENEYQIKTSEPDQIEEDTVLDYLEELNLNDILTDEEFQELEEDLSEENKERIVMDRFNQIAKIALYFLREGIEYIELVQEGTVGLVKGLNMYSYDNGNLKKYLDLWVAREMAIYIAERFEQTKQEFIYYITKTEMEDVEITKNEIDEKLKKIENISIDDIPFVLSQEEIKSIELYFGLGYEKRYSILEIEKEMKLEKDMGEKIFTTAFNKISARGGRMFLI